MPLSSPRRAALSATHHLVGIIQCRVWLSCFTKHFSPGLIITVSLEGWVTAISASTPLFTVLVRHFVNKMCDRGNTSFHELS